MDSTIKILDSFNIKQYAILLVDDPLKIRKNKIKIDNDVYDVIVVSDAPNAIAVISNKSFAGKEATLV